MLFLSLISIALNSPVVVFAVKIKSPCTSNCSTLPGKRRSEDEGEVGSEMSYTLISPVPNSPLLNTYIWLPRTKTWRGLMKMLMDVAAVIVRLPVIRELTYWPLSLVAVAFCKVVPPSTVKVEVTVELAPTEPPYNWSVEVAELPRAETLESVSVPPLEAGQLVPFERQTATPPTVNDVPKAPVFAMRRVVEAMPLTNILVVVALVVVELKK